MFTSALVLAVLLLLGVNYHLWSANSRLLDSLNAMTGEYATISRLLSGLLKKPEVTAGEIVKKKQHRPFRTIKTWDEQRAELEAQYPDPFEAALKQVKKNEQVMKES